MSAFRAFVEATTATAPTTETPSVQNSEAAIRSIKGLKDQLLTSNKLTEFLLFKLRGSEEQRQSAERAFQLQRHAFKKGYAKSIRDKNVERRIP